MAQDITPVVPFTPPTVGSETAQPGGGMMGGAFSQISQNKSALAQLKNARRAGTIGAFAFGNPLVGLSGIGLGGIGSTNGMMGTPLLPLPNNLPNPYASAERAPSPLPSPYAPVGGTGS